MTDEANTTRDAASPEAWSTVLTHRRLLGARLYLHSFVRLFVVFVIIGGAFFVRYVIGIENLAVGSLVVLAIVIGAYNAVAYYLTRHHRALDQSPEDIRRLVAIMYAAIVLDFLALTVAVWLVGGSRSPFLTFYLLHISLACLLLTRRAAVTFTALAYALLVALVLGELFDIVPPRQPVGAIGGTGPIDGRYAFTVMTVYLMLFGVTSFLLLSLTARLREGEHRVRLANVELERLSEMRRDFLHIALHNIQSPIGAVTMYLKNMDAGMGGPLSPKQQRWLARSLARLDGLNEFLQNFRMLNTLESGKIDARSVDVDVVALVGALVEEHRELATYHEHDLRFEHPAPVPPVRGIERLLREAAVNYLTNAIKYTPDGGRITVRVLHRPPHVRIEVQDDGIGISKSDQAKLFGEFVRLNRVGTPVAHVGGSGLGLSIVRRVIESLGGRAFVESEPGRGSTFVIELPAVADGTGRTVGDDGEAVPGTAPGTPGKTGPAVPVAASDRDR